MEGFGVSICIGGVGILYLLGSRIWAAFWERTVLPDAETMSAIAHVENKLLGEIVSAREEARIAKHDVKQVQMSMNALDIRLTKLQDKTELSFEKLSDKVASEVRGITANMDTKLGELSAQIAMINVQQGRGAGFFAGISAVIVGATAIIMFLGKILFGGSLHP